MVTFYKLSSRGLLNFVKPAAIVDVTIAALANYGVRHTAQRLNNHETVPFLCVHCAFVSFLSFNTHTHTRALFYPISQSHIERAYACESRFSYNAACTCTQDTLAAVQAKLGAAFPTDGQHYMFFLPTNYKRGSSFSTGAVGVANVGGPYSYFIDCQFSTVGHEIGHNLKLGHSGALSTAGE